MANRASATSIKLSLQVPCGTTESFLFCFTQVGYDHAPHEFAKSHFGLPSENLSSPVASPSKVSTSVGRK